MKRLADQVYVLEAISSVRAELKRANKRGANNLEMSEIFTRLTSLYPLLNVDKLKDIVEQADVRGNKNERKAA
jgi:hypothetical protein